MMQFNPQKSYATYKNAEQAATKICAPGDLFLIARTLESARYAPIFYSVQKNAYWDYAHKGFTVLA